MTPQVVLMLELVMYYGHLFRMKEVRLASEFSCDGCWLLLICNFEVLHRFSKDVGTCSVLLSFVSNDSIT